MLSRFTTPIVGIVITSLCTLACGQSLSESLEKGVHEEEAGGNLNAAIETYSQIVAKARKEAPLVAEAQYRLGTCYLKAHRLDEAAAAFQELLDRYPAEAEWTKKARAELTKLGSKRMAPSVVKTTPECDQNDVSPELKEITVTFDRPMLDQSWSWTGGGDTYPKAAGKVHYNAGKTTCVMPVKLEPGKAYWVGINSPSHRNFQSVEHMPAAWQIIVFATAGADGKPTPIPEDMLEKARKINANLVRCRSIDKAVADFPAAVDLSTPESAAAAWNRASGKMDADAMVKLSWTPLKAAAIKQELSRGDKSDIEMYNKAQLDGRILEVSQYGEDVAIVVTLLKFPEGKGRHPYSVRYLGNKGGEWKNLGEDRMPSVEAARETFQAKKDTIRERFAELCKDGGK